METWLLCVSQPGVSSLLCAIKAPLLSVKYVATNTHTVVHFDSIQNAPSCFHKYGTKLQTPDGFINNNCMPEEGSTYNFLPESNKK